MLGLGKIFINLLKCFFSQKAQRFTDFFSHTEKDYYFFSQKAQKVTDFF